MRVIYRYFDSTTSERFLQRIEDEKELEVSSTASFADVKRLLKAIGHEPALVVLEKSPAEDSAVFDLLRNASQPRGARRIVVLVLAIVRDPSAVIDRIERAGAKYLVRRDGIEAEQELMDALFEIRRFLRRVMSQGLLRLEVFEDDSVRIWVTGRDRVEHEWVLSPQFERLVRMLAQTRYLTVPQISKELGIAPKSVNTYLDRLRDYFDRFNGEKLHLPLRGKDLFKTLHYADLDIYRLDAAVEWTKNTG